MKYARGFPKKRKCNICGIDIIANSPTKIYCGDSVKKTGCSYKQRVKNWIKSNIKTRNSGYYECEKWIEYYKEWKKNQRKNNTEYYKRQKKANKKWREKNIEHIKSVSKKWRQQNSDRILENNRKRRLKLKNVKGSHTKYEWEKLKKKNNYKCKKCGISEKELKNKWEVKNKAFSNLTKDHIVPLSKGGNDFIENIQPLCISCNSIKKDKSAKIGLTAAVFDILHKGHFELLEEINKVCDYVIVVLHDDYSTFLNKNKFPIQSLDHRLNNLMLTGLVDEIIPTFKKNPVNEFKKVLKEYEGNEFIFMRGDDVWNGGKAPGVDYLEAHNIPIIYKKYTKGISSSLIRENLTKS